MSGFVLPEAPAHLKGPVKAWSQPVVIPTYRPMPADKNPMFLEKRVYQGSSGKVYPLPFVDRISETKEDVEWEAVHLENEYVRLMILPQIGGRIHVGLDKTNGYDFFYRQNVIKPALVGLAGPWISGGVEFNWPQHHRPSTFMPVDWEIEDRTDLPLGIGGVTVWCSEHEPMNRMKAMHGVRLKPGSSLIELKVRLYNRTELMQTFLWWANAAVHVHERYQAFFPPDVTYVADHAKRAMSRFPLCDGKYYGVDYGGRVKDERRKTKDESGVWEDGTRKKFVPPVVDGKRMYAANDLRWYANIPVPTSYMAMGSKQDFFGGYDHAKQAGIVHVADHRIAPGKKLWTWGNHEFGYAWDRNLTDSDGPYAELMAGIFTDNQPDFSYLTPGETREFSQHWFPIQQIGPAQMANIRGALSLAVSGDTARVGVAVTMPWPEARVRLERGGEVLTEWTVDLAPDAPLVQEVKLPAGVRETELRLALRVHEGRELIAYQPLERKEGETPAPASEPALPEVVQSVEELYLIGVHLEQYRHATRDPAAYWREGLRRNPGDSRCNNARGLWHVRRGEFAEAVKCFEAAIGMMTKYNPNPRDGEVFYNLGIAQRYLNRLDEAYGAFHKATWNEAWRSAATVAIAQIDCRRGELLEASIHLGDSWTLLQYDVRASVLRNLTHHKFSGTNVPATAFCPDRTYAAAKFFRGESLGRDDQTRLDLALEFAAGGFNDETLKALKDAVLDPGSGTAPLVHYYRAYFLERLGKTPEAEEEHKAAAAAPADYCFPSRLEEIGILREAMEKNPADARAPYYLGCLLYDKRRHKEAIALWEKAIKLDRSFATAWRNVGIGYYNVLHDAAAAKGAYTRAFQANPADARVFYERDQLWKRTGERPEKRLEEMEKYSELVKQRDDLTVEYCALLNQLERYEEAQTELAGRRFQPWEGGEGLVLGQFARTQVALGRRALWRGEAVEARKHFEAALAPPENLGETWHLLANRAEAQYWLGMACKAQGDAAEAQEHLQAAAGSCGDFREMSVCAYSEMSYYAAVALQALDRLDEAKRLLAGMLDYALVLAKQPAKIDYFATSLPAMLLFEDDLKRRQTTQAALLEALARAGLGEKQTARRMLGDILRDDPNHALAADFMVAIDWET